MKAGLAALIGTAWRPSTLRRAQVDIAPGNFGTMGSRGNHQTQQGHVHLRSVRYSTDPRLRAFNGLFPIVWRMRDQNLDRTSAVAQHAQAQLSPPVTFTPPATASLLFKGGSAIGG